MNKTMIGNKIKRFYASWGIPLVAFLLVIVLSVFALDIQELIFTKNSTKAVCGLDESIHAAYRDNLIENYNPTLGSVYNYNLGRIVYTPELGLKEALSAIPLNTSVDCEMVMQAFRGYINQQNENGFQVDTTTGIYISTEEYNEFLFNGQDETFLGIDAEDIYPFESQLPVTQFYYVLPDGSMAVGEFPPPMPEKPGFGDRFAAFALTSTMAISGIVILVVSTPCGGATNPVFQMLAGACFGAVFEVFGQALSGKGITELNWLKIGVGALGGALSAIPIPGAGLAGKALGYVAAGLVGGATDATMMAIDGGSWQECLKAFGVGALKAIAIRGATQLISKMVSRAGCFIAGTAIATLGGPIAIENLRVGYMVLSRNDMLGIVEYKPITDLYRYTAQELTHIELNNGTTIVSTSEHPYYVFNTGYIDAINLRAGDVLILADAKTVVVEKIQNELLEKPITVCNIAVADNRNYFVSEVGGDSDSSYILVHNSCAHQTGEWKKFRGDYWKAEGVKGSASEFASINKKNLALMTKGKAPFVIDGYKIELHHIEGIKVNFDNVVPLTRTQHQLQHLYESLFGGLK